MTLTPAELRDLKWLGNLYSVSFPGNGSRMRVTIRWSESYSIVARTRKRLRRLARLGLVRGRSTGAYQITKFGLRFIGVTCRA